MSSSDQTGEVKSIKGTGDLVRQWNLIRDEYEKLNANWSPAVAGRLVELSREMAVISDACIAFYALSDFIDPASAIERWSGKSLKNALKKQYDDDALTALMGKIVSTVGNSSKQIWDAFEHANEQPLGEDETEICVGVNYAIWCFLSAFWEVGTVRALGKPENVWVAANVRNTMAGLVHQSMVNNGDTQANRDDILASFANFIGDKRTNFEWYFEGEESYLGGVYSVTVFYNSDKSEYMGDILDQVFASFVKQSQDMPKQLIDGTYSIQR